MRDYPMRHGTAEDYYQKLASTKKASLSEHLLDSKSQITKTLVRDADYQTFGNKEGERAKLSVEWAPEPSEQGYRGNRRIREQIIEVAPDEKNRKSEVSTEIRGVSATRNPARKPLIQLSYKKPAVRVHEQENQPPKRPATPEPRVSAAPGKVLEREATRLRESDTSTLVKHPLKLRSYGGWREETCVTPPFRDLTNLVPTFQRPEIVGYRDYSPLSRPQLLQKSEWIQPRSATPEPCFGPKQGGFGPASSEAYLKAIRDLQARVAEGQTRNQTLKVRVQMVEETYVPRSELDQKVSLLQQTIQSLDAEIEGESIYLQAEQTRLFELADEQADLQSRIDSIQEENHRFQGVWVIEWVHDIFNMKSYISSTYQLTYTNKSEDTQEDIRRAVSAVRTTREQVLDYQHELEELRNLIHRERQGLLEVTRVAREYWEEY